MNISTINLLLNTIEKEQYKGYDPHDFKATDFYLKTIAPNRFLKVGCDILNLTMPRVLRKTLGVKANLVFSGTLAYMLEGYCYMYKATQEDTWYNKAIATYEQLQTMAITAYGGMGWGLPIGWQSSKEFFFSNQTPNVVNTAEVASAILELYSISKSPEHLNCLEKITAFITSGLKITYEDEATLCYSYTPVDNYQVHNANLLAGVTLVRIGTLTSNQKLIQLAHKIALFAAKDQTKAGYLPYYATSYANGSKAHSYDLYHSGYELRSLDCINKVVKDKAVETCILQLRTFFNTFYFQKAYPLTSKISRVEKIDIHGCAEAIYCNTMLSQSFPEALALAKQAADWTIKNMMTSKGYFHSSLIGIGFLKIRARIIYMRWGQSVMFRALTKLYLAEKIG